ncbi:hypothetical protein BaRGS_00018271 [Batillaria attramentaria]|uniref:Uncharacterized protein n=1 Tax=Batillaria attramentaria TaxID=370345 RepID=A0ABD0KTI3_9CAEN
MRGPGTVTFKERAGNPAPPHSLSVQVSPEVLEFLEQCTRPSSRATTSPKSGLAQGIATNQKAGNQLMAHSLYDVVKARSHEGSIHRTALGQSARYLLACYRLRLFHYSHVLLSCRAWLNLTEHLGAFTACGLQRVENSSWNILVVSKNRVLSLKSSRRLAVSTVD